MAHVGLGCKVENSRVPISSIGMEVSEAVEGVWPRAHERPEVFRFRLKMRENIKGVGRNSDRLVRQRHGGD